jgi:archaellum component FlaC
MKKAKLNKLLVEAQKAHKQSSVAFKEISSRAANAKKAVKEKKRQLAEARKECKSARKTYRELARKLKEVRSEHRDNNQRLEKLSRKVAKLSGAAKTVKNDSKKAPAPKRNASVSAPDQSLVIVS